MEGREQPDPAVQRLAALGVLASNRWREGREQLPKDCRPAGAPVPHCVRGSHLPSAFRTSKDRCLRD